MDRVTSSSNALKPSRPHQSRTLYTEDSEPQWHPAPGSSPPVRSWPAIELAGNLQAPGQDPVELTFFPLTELPNGELAVDPDANPLVFSAGSTYGFQVEASGANGARTSLATTTAGTVMSVRIVDGFPVLVVGGQDIDPTQILRIQ